MAGEHNIIVIDDIIIYSYYIRVRMTGWNYIVCWHAYVKTCERNTIKYVGTQ